MMAAQGGGIAHSRQGLLQLANCTVAHNRALFGGGIGGQQVRVSGNRKEGAGVCL